MPEDRALRRVQDRGAQQAAEHAAVRDAERPAGQLLDAELAVLDGRRQPLDLALDLGEPHPLGVPQHRDGQPPLGADRDPEVDEVVVHDVLALDAGVDARELLQGQHDGPAEEAHEPQPDPVRFLELVLELRPQRP
jgi:hypothetical protein